MCAFNACLGLHNVFYNQPSKSTKAMMLKLYYLLLVTKTQVKIILSRIVVKSFTFPQVAKQQVSPNGEPISFLQRVAMAATAGACGGVVGTPGDMINVRMQNDIKLPKEQRRK